MSDLIVINKCDGNNIEESIKAKNEFKLALQLFPIKNSNWEPKVVTCSSIEKEGLEERSHDRRKVAERSNVSENEETQENCHERKAEKIQFIISNLKVHEARKPLKNFGCSICDYKCSTSLSSLFLAQRQIKDNKNNNKSDLKKCEPKASSCLKKIVDVYYFNNTFHLLGNSDMVY